MAGSTNVDKAGKWVFEVGGTSIKDPRSVCGNSGKVRNHKLSSNRD